MIRAHGIMTLVDLADSNSVRKLSDALYLIVLPACLHDQ